MEGLEATEVMLSYAKNNNEIFRFDSTYFQKKYLLSERVIRNIGSITLSKAGVETKSFGAYSLNNEVTYMEDGIPFIRGINMKKGRVNFDEMLYITKEANALLWKSEVNPEMILLSMSGTIGDIAIASKHWQYPINSNQDIAKIDTKGAINSYFLFAFLRSEYGQNYLNREARGSVQQHVFLSQIDQFEIPIFSKILENQIQAIIEKSDNFLLKHEISKNKANNLLINAFDLKKLSSKKENNNIKSFSESFGATGRLDAEYYQAKYDELEAKIAKTHTLGLLRDFVTVNQRGTQPNYAEYGLPVINSKHVREGEVLLSDDNRFAILPDKDDALTIKKGDVLINGTGVGTIGRSAPYLHEQEAIPDNHVTILRTDKIDPIFLSVYLNSIAGKYQVEKYFKGSSGQIELYPTDIGNFYVPIVESSIQIQIADFVRQSFTLKAKSEQLLEAAKRAVEIAIEDSEEAAMHYLQPFMQEGDLS